jgi:hypothetical protein
MGKTEDVVRSASKPSPGTNYVKGPTCTQRKRRRGVRCFGERHEIYSRADLMSRGTSSCRTLQLAAGSPVPLGGTNFVRSEANLRGAHSENELQRIAEECSEPIESHSAFSFHRDQRDRSRKASDLCRSSSMSAKS